MTTRRVFALAVAWALLLAVPALAAPPGVPARITYQGVLLDDLGQPRTGSVDLTLRIFDDPLGGVLVYEQGFSAVALTAGVFTVELGPSGSGVGTLTTSLSVALAGDAGVTAPSRFLEVTVGLDGPLARTQILSVPYALRASEADVAATALDASAVAGFSSTIFQQIVEDSNLDLTGPINSDPAEGFGDTDNDGFANFVDPDNDNDGLDDGTEVAQGSDINLVTPTVSGLNPSQALASATLDVRVSGTNFDPAMSVSFGTESPSPANLTSTDFDAMVGPQAAGGASVQVTLPNGESALLGSAFQFLASVSHGLALSGAALLRTSVGGGAQTVVSGEDDYRVDTDGDTIPDTTFAFPGQGRIAVAFDPSGTLVGVRCRSTGGGACDVEVATDGDADFDLDEEAGVVLASLGVPVASIKAPSIAFDASGNLLVGHTRENNSISFVILNHDLNGNGLFGDAGETVVVEAVPAPLLSTKTDSAGRVAVVYHDAVVGDELNYAWDRNGDGDFNDTVSGNPELGTLVGSVSTLNCLGAGFAPDDDLAIVYASAAGTFFARDGNADGDFTDAGETTTFSGTAAGACDADGGDFLVVAHDVGGPKLLVDRNDDGDFLDTDEISILGGVGSLGRAAVAHNGFGRAFLASDTLIHADPIP